LWLAGEGAAWVSWAGADPDCSFFPRLVFPRLVRRVRRRALAFSGLGSGLDWGSDSDLDRLVMVVGFLAVGLAVDGPSRCGGWEHQTERLCPGFP